MAVTWMEARVMNGDKHFLIFSCRTLGCGWDIVSQQMVFLFLCITLLKVKALCVRGKGENPSSKELPRVWLGVPG